MDHQEEHRIGEYAVRRARPEDVEGARRVMLDTFYKEFGHGYHARWHSDVVDIEGAYLKNPRHALFVAVRDGEVAATTAIRSGGPRCPPHPEWLAARYGDGSTAQLFRVYVDRQHRRNGLASALVSMACDFVADTPEYSTIYLHTNPAIEGAAPFWRSAATEIYDAREDSRYSPSVHFEIPIPGRSSARPGEAAFAFPDVDYAG
ncbi:MULTISPECIES: GNAT family N-acetyltransferase [Saccharopolyspora]|nr:MULTISPECIES: GNAT family N-acetyltransferase [Saccharopolyspora]MCA1187622.1 GNAT family N-acetyltransferase [Saccharopolyspora sp. 6T]MCA1228638.1 GNAT family N-acetyltransferase [Saccharopolyspora sp. 6M]